MFAIVSLDRPTALVRQADGEMILDERDSRAHFKVRARRGVQTRTDCDFSRLNDPRPAGIVGQVSLRRGGDPQRSLVSPHASRDVFEQMQLDGPAERTDREDILPTHDKDSFAQHCRVQIVALCSIIRQGDHQVFPANVTIHSR